jgi:lipoprotein signal peptidase
MGLEWFQIHFIENEGMAYGWKFGGDWGKMILTLFRLGAVVFGVWYIRNIIQKKYHRGFIVCAALIFAGALGNLIDSMFYGITGKAVILLTIPAALMTNNEGGPDGDIAYLQANNTLVTITQIPDPGR